jgi:hypothetical protein
MFLIIITFLSAISISIIAAGYSIIGLATLFAGAAVPIIAMGTALEIGKLIAASWLYNNWRSSFVPVSLKTYLFSAVVVLVFITSMGIFGFLSKAHLEQVQPTTGNEIKINSINTQISQQETIINRAEKTLAQLDKSIEVYLNNEYATRGLKERKKQEEERNTLQSTINTATDKIVELQTQKANLQLQQDKIEAEVGPIKYVAELIYGKESAKSHFDEAVRIVILILIFVFDPLAVLLLIAANISLRQWRMNKSLTKKNNENYLQKRIEKLIKRNQKLRGYENLAKEFGDDPDEIKLKLNQIMDLNDKNNNN